MRPFRSSLGRHLRHANYKVDCISRIEIHGRPYPHHFLLVASIQGLHLPRT